MEEQRNRKIGLITFILCVIFMMAACHMTGQESCKKRYYIDKKNPKIPTVTPCNAILVDNYVNVLIAADSVGKNLYNIDIVATYPKEEKVYSIGFLRLTFMDTTYVIKHSYVNKETGQVNFQVTPEAFRAILNEEIITIEVFNEYKRFASGGTTYFKEFIKSLFPTSLVNK